MKSKEQWLLESGDNGQHRIDHVIDELEVGQDIIETLSDGEQIEEKTHEEGLFVGRVIGIWPFGLAELDGPADVQRYLFKEEEDDDEHGGHNHEYAADSEQPLC